jgi:hypothetical protein
MQLESFRQVNMDYINSIEIDAIIASSGYERRSVYIPNIFSKKQVPSLIAFGFTDRKVLSRKANDKRLKEIGYSIYLSNGSDYSIIREKIDNLLKSLKKNEVNILIDYSCMTRVWYASLLDLVLTDNYDIENINLLFAYSPAKFAPPSNMIINKHMGPLPGFCHLGLPSNKESALIIGLGYEKERAIGLAEYVEAAEIHVFYTDPSHDIRFTKTLLGNNRILLRSLPKDRIYKYSSYDLKSTNNLLTDICLELSEKYRVILAPLGPKPFSLLCLLLTARYIDNDIDVWRVSSGDQSKPKDRDADGDLILYEVHIYK